MTHWVDEILRQFGQDVTLRRWDRETNEENVEPVRAFLQPLKDRDELEPEWKCEIGWLDGRLWLYLGKAKVRAGDCLEWMGMRFRVRSGRPHYLGDTLSHWRAVLEREREVEGCGN